jgi:hypothetical protein
MGWEREPAKVTGLQGRVLSEAPRLLLSAPQEDTVNPVRTGVQKGRDPAQPAWRSLSYNPPLPPEALTHLSCFPLCLTWVVSHGT